MPKYLGHSIIVVMTIFMLAHSGSSYAQPASSDDAPVKKVTATKHAKTIKAVTTKKALLPKKVEANPVNVISENKAVTQVTTDALVTPSEDEMMPVENATAPSGNPASVSPVVSPTPAPMVATPAPAATITTPAAVAAPAASDVAVEPTAMQPSSPVIWDEPLNPIATPVTATTEQAVPVEAITATPSAENTPQASPITWDQPEPAPTVAAKEVAPTPPVTDKSDAKKDTKTAKLKATDKKKDTAKANTKKKEAVKTTDKTDKKTAKKAEQKTAETAKKPTASEVAAKTAAAPQEQTTQTTTKTTTETQAATPEQKPARVEIGSTKDLSNKDLPLTAGGSAATAAASGGARADADDGELVQSMMLKVRILEQEKERLRKKLMDINPGELKEVYQCAAEGKRINELEAQIEVITKENKDLKDASNRNLDSIPKIPASQLPKLPATN